MVKFDVRRNYYEDLELGPSAETEEIKKQFRKLALKYHPDRNPGRESEFFTKFQAIQVAHEILCDPRQRFKYDTERLGAGYGRLYQNAASQENTSSYAAGKTATPKPSRRASSQQPSLDKAQRYANFPEAAPQQTEADASRAFRAMLLPKTVSSNFDPSGPEGGQSRTSTRGRSTTRNNLGTQTNSGSSSDEAARAQASMAQTQPPVSAEAWAQRLQDTEWAVPNPNSEYAQPHEKTSSTRQGRNISRPTSRTTRPQQPAVSTEADEDEATIPEPVQGNSTSILDAMEIDKETQPNKMVTSDFKQSQLSKSKANVSVVNSDQASEQKSDLFNLGNLHEIEPFASTKDSKMDDLEVYETSADSSDKLSFPSPERSSIPMTSVPTIFSQNSKEVDSQDTETIYSEISMVSATAKHKGYIIELASEIANEILRDQLDDRTMERIISVFPGLIKGFALRIGYRASTQMHRDVMFFAHKHRNEIAGQIKDKYIAEKQQKPHAKDKNMELNDKMDLWFGSFQGLEDLLSNEHSFQPYEREFDEQSMDVDIEEDDQLENDQTDSPDLFAYKEFILNSLPYKLLLARLRKEVVLTMPSSDSLERIRQEIATSLAPYKVSRKQSAQSYKLAFVMDWDVLAFIRAQGYTEPPDEAFEKAITLTGSSQEAQALTCLQYVSQTWPLAGEHTFRLIQDLIRSEQRQSRSATLPDGAELTIEMSNKSLRVVSHGTKDSVIEIGEQLAWLGGALRSSPYESGITYCTPDISLIHTSNPPHISTSDLHATFQISFIMRQEFKHKEPPRLVNGKCWHDLFRNPVIVTGYPIRRRAAPKTGLEIPLAFLTTLSQTRYVNTFDNKIFIKGFSTMLYPVKRFNDLVIWHLKYTKDGGRISYVESPESHTKEVSSEDLKFRRHILGWCSPVTNYTGSLDANYNIKGSGLDSPSTGAFVGSHIANGQMIFGPMCAIGNRDVPLRLSARDGYILKLNFICMKYVVLWDEADKRGWLVNGASALLHLVLASIERDSQGPLRSHFLFKKNELRGASDPDDVFAAMSVLCNPNNWSLKIFPSDGGHVLLKHRIESLFEYLEKMMDYQTKIFQERVSSSRSNEAPRSQLEGWDFQDLASGRDVIVSRAAHIDTMGKGWIDFTRSIRAITLFGRQFGELIKPAANVGCSHWAQVPERHFYLAASVADIQAIMRMDGDDEVNPRKLCNGVFWYHSEKVFDLCKCKGNGLNAHHDAVQSLMPSHLVKRLVPRPSLELKVDGAVIFGHNRDSGWTWNDTGDPREGVSDLLYPVEKPYTTLPDNERQETSNFSAVSSSGGKSSTYLRNGSFSIDTATTQTSVSEVHTDETGRLQCPLETKIFSRNDYRVGIICALPKELKAVRALFDSKHNDMNVPRDTNRYALGRMGQCNVVAACLPSGEYGTNSAAAVSAQMRLSFRQLQFCLLVGIGGGVPSDEHDIRLGDVVVSHPREAGSGVIQYDLGKARRGNFKTTGHLQAPPRLLMSAISDILSNPDISPNVLEDDIKMISDRHPEYKCPDVHKDTLYKASYMHNPRYKSCQQCKGGEILRNPRTGSYPLIHYGLIASGNSLMRDGRMRDRLGKKHNVLCFEMEAAGVVNTIPCLVIRGICDYCDSHKNKLWQEYAAATAAAYAKLLLSIACHIDDSEGISQM